MLVAIRHDVNGEAVTSTGTIPGPCETGDMVCAQVPDENGNTTGIVGSVIEIISE